MRPVDLAALDLNLLVAMDTLLRERSVTRAAAVLHLSQPAASRVLARLRDLMGDPILVRIGHEMVPTPRAKALEEPLRDLLARARDLLGPPAAFDPAQSQRRFCVLSSDYAQVVIIGPALQVLERAAPGVRLAVEGAGADAFDRLAAGSADLLIGPTESLPSWAEATPLLADPWVCVRRQGLPLPGSVGEYLAMPRLLVGARDRIGLAAGGGPASAAVVEVPDFAGALFVVASSSVAAAVPRPIAEAGASRLSLHFAPLDLPPVEVSLVWSRRLSNDPAHAWLRAVVREVTPR